MSRWDRYVLRPRVQAETSESETVPHIGPYTGVEDGGGSGSGIIELALWSAILTVAWCKILLG